jgi:hypothetical protein
VLGLWHSVPVQGDWPQRHLLPEQLQEYWLDIQYQSGAGAMQIESRCWRDHHMWRDRSSIACLRGSHPSQHTGGRELAQVIDGQLLNDQPASACATMLQTPRDRHLRQYTFHPNTRLGKLLLF